MMECPRCGRELEGRTALLGLAGEPVLWNQCECGYQTPFYSIGEDFTPHEVVIISRDEWNAERGHHGRR